MVNDQVKFYWEFSDDIFIGKNIVEKDNSIIFYPLPDIGPFSLYLFDWTLEIPTGTISKDRFRYLGGYFFPEKMININLTVPKAKKGIVKFNTSFDNLCHGFYYNEFYNFVTNQYYDSNSNWFAVGDLKGSGTAIEFASNNIAIIDNDNNLICIYAKLYF